MQLVGSVLYGADEQVAAMVAARIPHARDGFGVHYVALGVVRDGKLAGGVVFHNFKGATIEMSGAFDDPRWCLPGTLRTLFAYPFKTANVANLLTITGRKNKKARALDEWLGFEVVGPIHKAIDGREDAILYQMPRERCRWLGR